MADVEIVEQPAGENPQALSRLCLDFHTRENDYRPALEAFLKAHRRQLELPDDVDLVQAYLERVFPNGLPGSAIFSNIALGPAPRFLLRPPVDGPLAKTFAANGRAPAFHVYLSRGVLVVVQFELAPHVPPRSFEQLFSGPVFINPHGLTMSPEDQAALAALPKHRQQAQERLTPYWKLLEWLERIARQGQCALRYDRVEFTGDREIRFQVRTSIPPRVLRYRLAGNLAVAVPLSASTSPEEWRSPDGPGDRGMPVGEVERIEVPESGNGAADQRRSVSGTIVVTVGEHIDVEALRQALPPQGFLLSSLAGELQPLTSQRYALTRLRNGQGFNPYLLEILFDPTSAVVPETVPRLELPATLQLNAEQREAVAKGVAARDLFLLLGPPGTGKTTVIEALCTYFAGQGLRVLVASQTNPAVDNVLARLVNRPGVRIVRYAQPERVDPGSRSLLPENVLSAWSSTVRQRAERRLRDIDENERALHAAAEGLQRAEALRRRFDDIRASVAGLENAAAAEAQARGAAANAVEVTRHNLDRAKRQHGAAQALLSWLERNNADLPTAELLEGTAPAQELTGLLGALRAAAKGARWALPWLADGPVSLAAAVGALQRARAYGQQAAQLAGLVDRSLALCQARPGEPPDPHLVELENQRAALARSENQADIARLVEINREVNTLRDHGWAEANRALREGLLGPFQAALPAELDDLTSTIRPDPQRAAALEALRLFLTTTGQRMADVLAARIPVLVSTTVALLRELDERGQACRKEDEQAAAKLTDAKAELDVTQERLNDARATLAELENRWKALWAEYPTKLRLQSSVPPLAADSIHGYAEDLRRRTAELSAQQTARQSWQRLRQEWLKLLDGPAALRHERLLKSYLRAANVVGATCNETGRRTFYEAPDFQPFDVVIIDEVSKATPPEVIMAALLAPKLILVGDYRQLPPMLREHDCSYGEAADDGQVDRTEFEQHRKLITASFFGQLFEAAPPALRHVLVVQFRMHPQIMQIDNQFYGGQLVAGGGEEQLARRRQHFLRIPDLRGGLLLQPNNHVIWLDSTRNQRGYFANEQQRGTSKVNPLEVELVVAMLQRLDTGLRQRGYGSDYSETIQEADRGRSVAEILSAAWPNAPAETLEDLASRDSIRLNGRSAQLAERPQVGDRLEVQARKPVAVITFYGAQLRELRQAIERQQRRAPDTFGALDIRTNTVDRFQGTECAIVLVSLVRAPKSRQLGEHVRRYERINVALSRAQELLVIVGAARTFRDALVDLPPLAGGAPRPVPVYRNILEIVKQFGGLRYANQLLA